jgi:hydrogenase maturation protease
VTPVHIIGVGSPFGDDQLGWLVIDALQHNHYLDQTLLQPLTYIKADRPGANLLELMQQAGIVILIDAMQTGAEPGTVKRFESHEVESLAMPWSSHGIGIASTLALARALGELPARLILYGIEIDDARNTDSSLSQFDIDKIVRILVDDVRQLTL